MDPPSHGRGRGGVEGSAFCVFPSSGLTDGVRPVVLVLKCAICGIGMRLGHATRCCGLTRPGSGMVRHLVSTYGGWCFCVWFRAAGLGAAERSNWGSDAMARASKVVTASAVMCGMLQTEMAVLLCWYAQYVGTGVCWDWCLLIGLPMLRYMAAGPVVDSDHAARGLRQLQALVCVCVCCPVAHWGCPNSLVSSACYLRAFRQQRCMRHVCSAGSWCGVPWDGRTGVGCLCCRVHEYCHVWRLHPATLACCGHDFFTSYGMMLCLC
jgi:hypothetical protein